MKELEGRMKEFRARFLTDYPAWASAVLGSSALQKILQRWRETGQAPDGGSYKPYSTKPMLVGRKSFISDTKSNVLFGSKKKRKELQWFTVDGHHLAVLPGGYKQLRSIQGAQTGHKDFIYRATMIKSLRPQSAGGTADINTRQVSTEFVTVCGPGGPGKDVELKKLEGNEKREGKMLLMVTQKEEKELNDILDRYITNQFNKMFNG